MQSGPESKAASTGDRPSPRYPVIAISRGTNRSLPVRVDTGPPREEAHGEAVRLLERIVDDDATDLYDQFVSGSELKASFRSAGDAKGLISAARHLGAGEA